MLTPSCAVGGIDVDGTGAVYSFDPVGSYERESCRAAGAASALVQPFLDNMVSLPPNHPGQPAERAHNPPLSSPNATPPPLAPQVYAKNQVRDPALPALEKGARPDLPLERVQALVTDAFTGATERHIEVGDGLDMWIIEAGKGARLVYLRKLAKIRCSTF